MTTIAYDRPVKDLVAQLSATGHVTHTAYKKTSVTLHHNGARLSHEGVLNVWKTRKASAQFDSDAVGAIAQFVKVNEYAWACGNTVGNQRSIHIEMANSGLAPSWTVADATWKSAARLAGWLFAKVIGERPSSANFFVHKHWYATACAGPYIGKVWAQIMAEAQKSYDFFKGAAPTPHPPAKPPTPKPASTRNIPQTVAIQRAVHVTADGKWGPGTQTATSAVIRRTLTNVRSLQGWVGTRVDGMWGPLSEAARISTVRKIQTTVGVAPDGKWGPISSRAWAHAVANNYNKF